MKRFTKAMQLEIVKSIVSGNLLIEEAMETYGVTSRRTLKRWLKSRLAEAKLHLSKMESNVKVCLDHAEQAMDKDEDSLCRKEKTLIIGQDLQIEQLYEVIALHERIHLLETMNMELREAKKKLLNEVCRLKSSGR